MSLAGAALLMVGALPGLAQADTGVVVCNAAENSHRGSYVIPESEGLRNPPARFREGRFSVGNDRAPGPARAAERSPALALCGAATPVDPPPVDTPPVDNTGGDGGGDIGAT